MIRNAVLFATHSPYFHNGKTVTPLTKVAGVTLLERALTALDCVGLRCVTVVTDVDLLLAENLRHRWRDKLHLRAQLRWVRDDLPVQFAADEPWLMLGCEVLFNPDIVAPLLDRRPGDPALTLVDRRVVRTYDPDRAVRVRTRGSQVLDVGRDVEGFDALAAGITVVPPAALEGAGPDGDRSGWLGILGQLVARRQLQAQDLGKLGKWHHVLDPDSLTHADWLVRAYGGELRGDEPQEMGAPGMTQRILTYIHGLLSEKRSRPVLMNPGPVMTTPRVKGALVHPDVCHRDEDYARVLNRVRRNLRQVCGGPEHDVLLLSGSGTAAMEATISSLMPQGKKLLVVSNGAFGERFAEIAGLHGIEVVHLRWAWGQLVDAGAVARALDADPELFAAIMVHHETSVGLLNPVAEVGRICRQRDRLLFVDAVASLGGEPLDVERDAIDVLISSANKCLHAISGISFVCVGPRVWPRVEDVRPRVYYLDLKRYRSELVPFTPAVSTCFALDAAVDELLRDGVAHRICHYGALNARIREAARRLGLRRFSETGHESQTITLFEVPAYVTFAELYEALKSRGYVIYGCKAHLKGRYFQVANMGDLSDEIVDGFLDALEIVLGERQRHARPQLVAVAR